MEGRPEEKDDFEKITREQRLSGRPKLEETVGGWEGISVAAYDRAC
jgi:hypothetical protein